MSKQTLERRKEQRKSGESLEPSVLDLGEVEARGLPRRLSHCLRGDIASGLALQGQQVSFPGLTLLHPRILFKNKYYEKRVAVLSGGGTGTEPFPAGCVGEGMLTGCVVGPFLFPPAPDAIFTAIKKLAVRNPGGVLALVPNYSNLVVNFALGCERARRVHIKVECVVIEDDIADNTFLAKRRGLAGCLFAFKIAGEMSTAGAKLSEITLAMKALGCRVASLAVSLEPGSVPRQPPKYSVPNQYASLGVGIHGEFNLLNFKVESLEKLMMAMVERVLMFLRLPEGSHLVVMVTNLGTLTTMEQLMATDMVHAGFVRSGMQVMRLYVGRGMTSLESYGLQVSCLDVTHRHAWLRLLDLCTEAPAWPGTSLSLQPCHPPRHVNFEMEERRAQVPENCMQLTRGEASVFEHCLEAACNALIANKERLDKLDGAANANTGTSLDRLATSVLGQLEKLPTRRVGITLSVVSKLAEQEVGGTSGAMYALLLRGAARNATDWLAASTGAIDILLKYSSAKLGDRTMLDAIVPAWEVYSTTVKEKPTEWRRGLGGAVEAAEQACQATKNMPPRAGLASCLNPAAVKDVDPGAQAVVLWLKAIHSVLCCTSVSENKVSA